MYDYLQLEEMADRRFIYPADNAERIIHCEAHRFDASNI